MNFWTEGEVYRELRRGIDLVREGLAAKPIAENIADAVRDSIKGLSGQDTTHNIKVTQDEKDPTMCNIQILLPTYSKYILTNLVLNDPARFEFVEGYSRSPNKLFEPRIPDRWKSKDSQSLKEQSLITEIKNDRRWIY